jgi:hypothetical protein
MWRATRFAAAGSCSPICARSEMRSWIDSGDHMSVIHPAATDAHGLSPTKRPIPDALVRDALAAIERGERRHDSRGLPLVVVEIRRDRFGREERAGASRGARHFFKALLQRVSNAHGDGCCAWCIHNVYIVSQEAQRAMKVCGDGLLVGGLRLRRTLEARQARPASYDFRSATIWSCMRS